MDKPYLRHLIEENRELLKNLYSGSPKVIQNELSRASDQSLDLLIRILYLVALGDICLLYTSPSPRDRG